MGADSTEGTEGQSVPCVGAKRGPGQGPLGYRLSCLIHLPARLPRTAPGPETDRARAPCCHRWCLSPRQPADGCANPSRHNADFSRSRRRSLLRQFQKLSHRGRGPHGRPQHGAKAAAPKPGCSDSPPLGLPLRTAAHVPTSPRAARHFLNSGQTGQRRLEGEHSAVFNDTPLRWKAERDGFQSSPEVSASRPDPPLTSHSRRPSPVRSPRGRSVVHARRERRSGTMIRARGVFGPLLLLLSALLPPLAGVGVGVGCPAGCLCASDILSCGSLALEQLPAHMPASTATLDFNHNRLTRLREGEFAALPRLDTLRLAHNRLARLAPGAFRNCSGLRHLDLSSNQLHVVEQHYFLELTGLQELLLYANRITRVESKALAGLGGLRKAYLSHNRLTDFPFFSIQAHSHPSLNTLDLSSNRMPKLPLEEIGALPAAVQSGLFLHNNTLICECAMYAMFRSWELRGYGSVRDYREEHTCLVYGERRASVRFFQHARFFENCSAKAQSVLGEPTANLLVYEGESAVLDCPTSLRGGRGAEGARVSYLWVSPDQELVAPPGNNGTLRMFPNGSLEIRAARRQDGGLYLCMALDRGQEPPRNESREVNVTVASRWGDEEEPFNTGFTTLLGCVVSLVLVLMYLYLTPCPCRCSKRPPPGAPPPATPSPGNECSGQSSILTPTPPATTEGPGRKVGVGGGGSKHVVFLEPIKEVQNGRLRAPEHPKPQHLLRAENDSVTSVYSDAPVAP
ncbi:hypothetical protein AAFF_G00344460 [Aldrovandia affinis]|uniref:Ig-like domain-containing protein n=1 Tax=Aldrovandia affinis TaxID=143900 RepID=A0AAD7WNZ7_9TELE|nr:hypothetical protein AAFF_G00344460 [Aldrovandia affinis]